MVGLKIRKIRKQEQMTIAKLAKLTGVSESYISQLEREILDPSVSLLRKIANVLHVPVTSFFDEEVESKLKELNVLKHEYISQLEREIVDPSISLLRKIADVLQVPVTSFFDEEAEKPILTKVKNRRVFSKPGIQLSWISPKEEKIEMIEFSIESNCTCIPEFFDKDVCILLTQGSVNIQMDDNEIILNEQDSIFIVKNIPYSIHAISNSFGLISAVKGNQ